MARWPWGHRLEVSRGVLPGEYVSAYRSASGRETVLRGCTLGDLGDGLLLGALMSLYTCRMPQLPALGASVTAVQVIGIKSIDLRLVITSLVDVDADPGVGSAPAGPLGVSGLDVLLGAKTAPAYERQALFGVGTWRRRVRLGACAVVRRVCSPAALVAMPLWKRSAWGPGAESRGGSAAFHVVENAANRTGGVGGSGVDGVGRPAARRLRGGLSRRSARRRRRRLEVVAEDVGSDDGLAGHDVVRQDDHSLDCGWSSGS